MSDVQIGLINGTSMSAPPLTPPSTVRATYYRDLQLALTADSFLDETCVGLAHLRPVRHNARCSVDGRRSSSIVGGGGSF